MFYLVEFYKDWADEMDINKTSVCTEYELKNMQKMVRDHGSNPFYYFFGTNEGWEGDETCAEVFESAYTFTAIPEDHYNILNQYRFRGNGLDLSEFLEVMLEGDESDE
jgi:hypothetical protein